MHEPRHQSQLGLDMRRLSLQMESAITLVLRFPGLLRPDNPSHKPILDLVCSDEDPADGPPAAEPEPADVKPVVAQARQAAALKAEQVSGRVSGRAAPKVSHIDLTDEGVQVKRQKVCTSREALLSTASVVAALIS